METSFLREPAAAYSSNDQRLPAMADTQGQARRQRPAVASRRLLPFSASAWLLPADWPRTTGALPSKSEFREADIRGSTRATGESGFSSPAVRDAAARWPHRREGARGAGSARSWRSTCRRAWPASRRSS